MMEIERLAPQEDPERLCAYSRKRVKGSHGPWAERSSATRHGFAPDVLRVPDKENIRTWSRAFGDRDTKKGESISDLPESRRRAVLICRHLRDGSSWSADLAARSSVFRASGGKTYSPAPAKTRGEGDAPFGALESLSEKIPLGEILMNAAGTIRATSPVPG